MDIATLLALLIGALAAGSCLAALRGWLRRRRPGTQRASGGVGWRALQAAGRARTRARNKGALEAEPTDKLGRAHRQRLARRNGSGPWR